MTAIEVANCVIAFAQQEQMPIGNLKLQYLLFLLWKEVWKQEHRVLFEDVFAAWQFGPCVPSVYWEFCEWGGLPITCKVEISLQNQEEYSLIKRILLQKKYLTQKVPVLRKMATNPNGAWSLMWQKGKGNQAYIPFHWVTKEAEAEIKKDIPEDLEGKTILFQIKMRVEKDSLEKFKKLEHHADWILDLDNWPEIQSVFDCHVTEI